MKPRSRKAKGRLFQNAVRETLLKYFPSLENGDIKTALMSEAGEDIKLSPAARKEIPFSIECKNQERLSIWTALKQAEKNAEDGQTPLLVFKRNRSKTYAVLELEDLLRILKT